jgi:hypothetical protein
MGSKEPSDSAPNVSTLETSTSLTSPQPSLQVLPLRTPDCVSRPVPRTPATPKTSRRASGARPASGPKPHRQLRGEIRIGMQTLPVPGLRRVMRVSRSAVRTCAKAQSTSDPSMGSRYPTALTEAGSDLRRVCLPRLCCAFRLSQPLDALFRPQPFRLYFMPVTPLG